MAVKEKLATTVLSFINEICGLREERDDFLVFHIFQRVAPTPEQREQSISSTPCIWQNKLFDVKDDNDKEQLS